MTRHFANEEAEMHAVGYDRAEDHRRHHDSCQARLDRLADRFRDRAGDLEMSLGDCFDSVITDIAKADLKFVEFLETKGLRAPVQ
ncbi:MAG: hypothetical protein VW405_11825 [Rhodospirillaceae bacterium]